MNCASRGLEPSEALHDRALHDRHIAGSLEDPHTSPVAGQLGYVPAPVVSTARTGWLRAWSPAIPVTAKDPRAAWEFVSWAVSKGYLKLYGERLGWVRVPPGSRLSTYKMP